MTVDMDRLTSEHVEELKKACEALLAIIGGCGPEQTLKHAIIAKARAALAALPRKENTDGAM